MESLGALLGKHELLLIFLVVVMGVLLGRVSIFGTRLGVAGVLFAGLALSALVGPAPDGAALQIAPIVRELGLVLFVYCIGLSSGPGFFGAWRSQGLRINLAVLASLVTATALTLLFAHLFDLDRGYAAGLFSGALTNTPALGAAAERLHDTDVATHPWLGYSVTYPFGVFGAILVLRAFSRQKRSKLTEEIAATSSAGARALVTANFKVTRPELDGKAIGELRVRDVAGVMISRLARGPLEAHANPDVIVPTKYTHLALGDTVTVVGMSAAIDSAEAYFGARSEARLELERDEVDMRRVLVSKRELVGKRLTDLDIDHRFGAQITRIRRADVDILPSPDMRLELGDRIRVVAPTARLPELSRYFGDSSRDLAQLDFVALAIGLCLGLLVALIPLPAPEGTMKLGVAGGTLVTALVLGRLGRTGPLIWSIPYEISTALRDFGLLLFLAGVGVSAGGALAKLPTETALHIFGAGALLTTLTSTIGLTLLSRWVGAPVIDAMGATTGLQTQPATLATAYELSNRSEQTYIAYAVAFPVAMIAKILLAQVIVMWLD
jgi:putative transport protein